jgi:hypothetical protein
MVSPTVSIDHTFQSVPDRFPAGIEDSGLPAVTAGLQSRTALNIDSTTQSNFTVLSRPTLDIMSSLSSQRNADPPLTSGATFRRLAETGSLDVTDYLDPEFRQSRRAPSKEPGSWSDGVDQQTSPWPHLDPVALGYLSRLEAEHLVSL